jgi:hypothetical protein
MEEHKQIYEYKKSILEAQYIQEIEELIEKRNHFILERKQLAMDKAQLDKLKQRFKMNFIEDAQTVSLENKILKKQKEDLKVESKEDKNTISLKTAELNARTKEIFKQELNLQRQLQSFLSKELKLNRAYDNHQAKIDQYCYNKRQLDTERDKIKDYALQLEEQSQVIYKYRSSIRNIRLELMDIRTDIDNKESLAKYDKAQISHAQEDIKLKNRVLLTAQRKRLNELNLEQLNKNKTVDKDIGRLVKTRKYVSTSCLLLMSSYEN